jgi:predicted dehydrogenase
VKPIQVCVIGAGFGQQVHVPVFRSIPGCEVAAICASTQEKAGAVADKLGIPGAYGNWQEMLDQQKPDLLAIATLPELQYEIARVALARKIAVLCEKPLSLSRSQAEVLRTLAASHGVPCMVDLEFPEIEAWAKCRKLLPEIGALDSLAITWKVQTFLNRKKLSSWKTDRAQGGAALYSFGPHVFHYLEWFAGPISSFSARLSKLPDDSRSSDTIFNLEGTFMSGARFNALVHTDYPGPPEHILTFHGKEPQAVLKLENLTKDYVQGFKLIKNGKIRSEATQPASDGRILAVTPLAKRLVAWIRDGRPSTPGLNEGVRIQNLIELAIESDKNSGNRMEA